MSEGRLLPAFGVGSARSRDYVATGTPTKGRGKRSEEGLEILSRLWSEEQVTMHGEYYQLNEASIAPKPIQRPLPLWVGGSAEQAIKRTAKWGTGWQAGIESPEEVAPVIAAIKARTQDFDRTIDEDHYGAGFGFRFGSPDEPIVVRYLDLLTKRLGKRPEGFVAVGDTPDIMRLLDRFLKAGVHKFVLRPIASGTADMIDQTKRLIDRVLPEIANLNG